jgi:O-antigen/teichoic acid export membrane protein
VANETIGNLLSRENPVVRHYVWHIFLIGMAMAYFEVFYAWSRVYLRSVFGNFMKEIFCRVGQSILLVLLLFDFIDVPLFLKALVALYLGRTLIMQLYAFRLRTPVLRIDLPPNSVNIIKYSLLIILGGSTAMVLLEVDKVMLNNYLQIENVAYYGVAGFIAMTIAVPARAMHQITYPLTAEYLNGRDHKSLKDLYHRSSLTLFTIAGWLFLIIILSLEDIYLLLPKGYSGGVFIVFWLGLAKLYDALLGNNNSILYNSNYYKSVLVLGVFLALMAIFFNMWLIPTYGLNGAAIASFSAFFIYNSLKIAYVKLKYKILPFSVDTLKIAVLIVITGLFFYFIELSLPPIINIGLKAILLTLVYFGIVYRFKISEDIYILMAKHLKK